jgi:hypothetical protein
LRFRPHDSGSRIKLFVGEVLAIGQDDIRMALDMKQVNRAIRPQLGSAGESAAEHLPAIDDNHRTHADGIGRDRQRLHALVLQQRQIGRLIPFAGGVEENFDLDLAEFRGDQSHGNRGSMHGAGQDQDLAAGTFQCR